jgi:hypothetical protein
MLCSVINFLLEGVQYGELKMDQVFLSFLIYVFAVPKLLPSKVQTLHHFRFAYINSFMLTCRIWHQTLWTVNTSVEIFSLLSLSHIQLFLFLYKQVYHIALLAFFCDSSFRPGLQLPLK